MGRRTNYISYKVQILCEIGLTNIELVRQTLESTTNHINDRCQKEFAIDKVARQMYNAYFDGDRTYCTRKE